MCVPGDRQRPGLGAWLLLQRQKQAAVEPEAPPVPMGDGEGWDDLQPVDLLGLELGYRLIALVDKNRQGDLLTRIKGVRRKFAQEVGFCRRRACARQPRTETQRLPHYLARRGGGRGEAFPACSWPSTPAASPRR